MKLIRTQDAVGHVLCHDMTQIIPGVSKGPRFRKGHVVTAQDVPVLLSMGKESLYVWEMVPGMVHEDDAARRLVALCQGEGMTASGPREGKMQLMADHDGTLMVDSVQLAAVNSVGGLIVATRHGSTAVRAGDVLCGTRVIPLAIKEETLQAAERAAGDEPLLRLLPFGLSSAAVITTGGEVARGLVADAFTPVVERKLASFGISVDFHETVDDDMDHILAALSRARSAAVDLIVCTGGMSVDPDDNTPGAIMRSGAEIITYGAPVLPGAMLLVGYYTDDRPVLGLPGCVMYAKTTVFDLILPRIASGVRLAKEDFVTMGEGGLCLGCQSCTYPLCPFGR